MILKALTLFLYVFITHVNGMSVDFTYDNLAGGWLKFHEPASRNDAYIRCDSEGSVLVSPVNSEVRDAVKNYLSRLGKLGLSIMSGVQADFSTGDYYSVEGVSLTKMPVTIESEATGDAASSESCVKWMTGKSEVKIVKCDDVLPFVCYKKRVSQEMVGCGTLDPAYKYDTRSGSCYKFHREAKPWMKAYMTCKKEQGYLAIINNQLENVVLNEIFAKNPANVLQATADSNYALVGIRDWLDGENWKTVKGGTLEDAGYAEWASGEPNNGHGNEHCGSIYRQGKYNDVDCNHKFSFICEKNPDILHNSKTL